MNQEVSWKFFYKNLFLWIKYMTLSLYFHIYLKDASICMKWKVGERFFPHRLVSLSDTFLMLPQNLLKTLVIIKDISCKMFSPQSHLSALSLWHSHYPNTYTFVHTSMSIKKKDVSWMLLYILCYYLELSIWHFPFPSTHRSEYALDFMKEDVRWWMISAQPCFTTLSVWHFPHINLKTVLSLSKKMWVEWCFLFSVLSWR